MTWVVCTVLGVGKHEVVSMHGGGHNSRGPVILRCGRRQGDLRRSLHALPAKGHGQLLQEGVWHLIGVVQSEPSEVPLVIRQIPRTEHSIREVEEASVVGLDAR